MMKQQQDSIVKAAVDTYRQWKRHILVDPLSTLSSLAEVTNSRSFSCSRSLLLLQGDQYICRIFYSVLRMIQLRQSSSSPAMLEELDPLEPEISGFRTIAARRSLEQNQSLQEDFVRMESRSAGETKARILLKRRNIVEPTFREVVEEFANDRGVLFQPRLGANGRKDGKQIFMFGTLPIYLEGDVVFCYKDAIWRPVSLDQIVGMASN